MKRAGAKLMLAAAIGLAVAACGPRHVITGRRVIVLGVDGLDHQLVADLMAQGRLQAFDRMRATGQFSPLATTWPPQSPVAWSTFITGLDPEGHGIFDFVHRDPETLAPFLSTSRAVPAGRTLTFGSWQFPLQAGRVDLLRRGGTFWEALEQRGVDTTIVRMPANFPPSGTATRELSGMGTPDMLGTYGTFSFFTADPSATERVVPGGVVIPVQPSDGVVRGAVLGPENPYRVDHRKTQVEFAAHMDAARRHVKLVVGREERVLQVGEWSDWVPVDLEFLPLTTLSGQLRFFLKALQPHFALYVSPINLDPLAPALPISSPAGYAADLAHANGRYYTQGIPEDANSLNAGVLSPGEFLAQARITADENIRRYRQVLGAFSDGFLFYYFGHVDQVSHMMWRARDPQHPAYTPADEPYRAVVEDLYVEMDRLVADTLAELGPEDVLVVMSDHGFASWRRSFDLNSWLRESGYLAVKDPGLRADPGSFVNVDWSRTRAYGLGLNGLYINTRGREASGIVTADDRRALAEEIAVRLEQATDPATGQRAISRVLRREPARPVSGDVMPDLVVGYAKGMRVSSDSALGAVGSAVFANNTDAWSGDHSMDPDEVPGILLSTRAFDLDRPSLQTLAAALLAEFGVGVFPSTKGSR